MKQELENLEYTKTNRIKSMEVKRALFWCGCDRGKIALKGKSRKCSSCGFKLKQGFY